MHRSHTHVAVVFGAYSALAMAFVWPLASAPHRIAVPSGDLYTHVWSLAWVVHQAAHDPWHLYDANIYWPYTKSLAYTESLLPQAAMAAPIRLLGGGPLLAHNVVLLLTFPLSGLGAYLLAKDLSRSRHGAFLAGLAYAFCAYRWRHILQLGVLSIQWLPFVLFFLGRSVRRPTRGHVAGLGLTAVAQSLSSGYYAVALALALAVAIPLHLRTALRRRTWRPVLLVLAAAATITAVAGLPYVELRERHGIQRSREECVHWSARPASYLNPGDFLGAGLPHARWLRVQIEEQEPLWPGLAVLALGAAGLQVRGRGRRLALGLSVVGVAFSLGPEVALGDWVVPAPFDLLRALPPVDMMRVPSRLGVLALLGMAVLAALGWRRLIRGRSRRVWFLAAVTLIVAESFPVGLGAMFRPAPEPPASADWLASAPRGPVLELPWDEDHGGDVYMYHSTRHWQPLVNGSGTFTAPGTRDLAVIAARWPTGYAARKLRSAGVRYVVVHLDRLRPRRLEHTLSRTELPRGVRLVFATVAERIYEIDRPGDRAAEGRLPAGDAPE